MKEKNVIISIKGIQSNDGDKDIYELVTDGTYTFSDSACEFTYMESELTGLEGTKTTFKVDNEKVLLTREGSLNSQMMFEKGKKHFFLYETPYGSATMGVKTHKLKTGLGESGGDIELAYAVDVDSVPLGKNEFKISIREA
ncbi:MAG TPA: DUF1934 domain-containing protein [Clostridiales bacterium]|jgi:uncharacterized beta-barrel protein YwiB (DUF1934 family)|nr:DUF1934 domain-containing protein [Clostridiales bacterium]